MKKYISFFICLACILVLAACGREAAPIVLPDTADIIAVDVTAGEDTVRHSNKAWINKMISNFSNARLTAKESVQDVPQAENYIKLDIYTEPGSSTLFAYEENGKFFIEQPYQGIYETDSKTYSQLQETE